MWDCIIVGGEGSDGGFVVQLADGTRERTRRVLLATDMEYRPPLLRGWSDDIVVLTDGPDDLEDDDRARLAEADITVDERPVAELASDNGELSAVVFADGTRLARKGVLVSTTLHQRSTLADQLGAESAEPTPVAENPIAVDGLYQTTATGVFAAGGLSAQMPQVAAAITSGTHAAAAVVQSLTADEYGLAVPEGRRRVDA